MNPKEDFHNTAYSVQLPWPVTSFKEIVLKSTKTATFFLRVTLISFDSLFQKKLYKWRSIELNLLRCKIGYLYLRSTP